MHSIIKPTFYIQTDLLWHDLNPQPSSIRHYLLQWFEELPWDGPETDLLLTQLASYQLEPKVLENLIYFITLNNIKTSVRRLIRDVDQVKFRHVGVLE